MKVELESASATLARVGDQVHTDQRAVRQNKCSGELYEALLLNCVLGVGANPCITANRAPLTRRAKQRDEHPGRCDCTGWPTAAAGAPICNPQWMPTPSAAVCFDVIGGHS